MKYLGKSFLKIFIIFLVTFIFVELSSKALVKFGFLNKGLPAWVSLRIHSDFAHWHPKNVTLNLEKKNCWVSQVTYDSRGLRITSSLNLDKNKKTIALLGDSMVENIELSDGDDLGAMIQSKLKNFNVLNYSSRGTGLADQTEIYKKLIKKQNVDYLFLFVTENDIYNNVDGFTTFYHSRFDYADGKVFEIEKNKEYIKRYNSPFSKFRRDGLLFLKNLDTYKLYLKYYYFFVTEKSDVNKQNLIIKKSAENRFSLSEKKKSIYKHIKKNFEQELDPKTQLHVFMNVRNYMFEPDIEDNRKEYDAMNFLISEWKNHDYYYNPFEFVKKKLRTKNKLSFPYLTFDCDAHYSKLGTDIMSDYVALEFIKNIVE